MVDPKHRSAVERFLNKTPPRHEPEVEEGVRDAYEAMRGREGITLDVRLSDGSCTGFSYAYLVRTEYVPGDDVRLHFGQSTIFISGRNLKGIYRRLLVHRVEAIQEGTDTEEGLKPEDSPHIDAITIINPEEETT